MSDSEMVWKAILGLIVVAVSLVVIEQVTKNSITSSTEGDNVQAMKILANDLNICEQGGNSASGNIGLGKDYKLVVEQGEKDLKLMKNGEKVESEPIKCKVDGGLEIDSSTPYRVEEKSGDTVIVSLI